MSKPLFANSWYDTPRILELRQEIQNIYLKSISGEGVPDLKATMLGQIYVDTTNEDGYLAIATGNGASDWKKVTP